MAIDLQSLSITSAFNSIVNYFRSQENNSKWRDLSSGAEGTFLIRLLSNVISTLSYRIVAQSRENYLSTAALPSSNVGIAVNLGYSVFRGSNLKRKIELIPNGSYTLPKFSVIGSYSDEYSILTLDDVDIQAGVPVTIRTVVGNVREESFIAGTSDIKIFSLFTTGISEDYILFKDSVEVPTTKVMKEMTDDKYLVRTNPYSSVDIAYLNTYSSAKYKYGTGTEITIRYVELADVPVKPYTSDMFTYGTLGDVVTISPYLPFESVNSIKVTAPIDHETQNLIRSKADYANRLRQLIPAIIDVNFKALTPTYTLISYLKDDSSLLTGTRVFVGNTTENRERLQNTEVAEVQGVLANENYFGTPLPDICVPRREVADLEIKIALKNKYKNVADINLDIENILKNYYNRALQVNFNTYELERKIEDLSYVRYARVAFKINTRETSTYYQLGHVIYVESTGKYYRATKVLGTTGVSEPENGWGIPMTAGEAIDTDVVVRDGSVYWKCFKRLPNMPSSSLTKWSADSKYGIGDYMYLTQYVDYMFKCVDLAKSSGGTSPDTTSSSIGDFIVDGGVVWVVIEKTNEASTWSSLTQYQLGQVVNARGGYSLECVSYTGMTGTDPDLEFELESYPIIEGSQTTSTFSVAGNKTFYFRPNDVITAKYSAGYTTFVVVSSAWDSSNNTTVITVVRNQGEGAQIDPEITYTELFTTSRGTIDGNILWTLIDDVDDVSYDWNSFVTFTHDLIIVDE